MDSFANSDRQYSDGQNNREPIPEEIQAYGLKPPVRLPDGSIELGDYLAANHLNFILNDVYKKLAAASGIVRKNVTENAGFIEYSDGRYEIWGITTPNASGVFNVTYPIEIPAFTYQIYFSWFIVSPSAAVRSTIITNSTKQGFTGNSFRNAGSSSVADTTPVLWRAFYVPQGTVGA